MTRGPLLKKTDIRALFVCGLAALHCFSASPPAFLVSIASAQEPSAPPEAPARPSASKPEKEEKVPPSAPPTLPGAPAVEKAFELQAPSPTATPPPPGLVDRFQQRLNLVKPGEILFNLTVEEAYDDNAFQTSTNTQSDFITVIVPAVAIDRTRRDTSFRLQYTPRILLYADFSELNRVNHSLLAAASWDPSPWLRVSLRDNLLITNDQTETSEFGISQTGLRKTTRNNLSVPFEFKLARRSDLTLAYNNTIRNEEDQPQRPGNDATIHSGSVAFAHRLSRGEINLGYTLRSANFDISSDFVGHEPSLKVSYRLNPSDELLLGIDGVFRDEKDDDNVTVFTAAVGFNHQFNPRLSATLNGGITVFGQDPFDADPRFFTDSSLTWTFPRGSLRLGIQQQFVQTFDTSDDQGVVNVLGGSGSFSYQLAPRLAVAVNGSYFRNDFVQQLDRTDLVGRVGINMRYQLWQLLTLTAGYNLFDRNSDLGGNDLTTNRVFIGLSLGYSTALPF
jgi:hypothetical protein